MKKFNVFITYQVNDSRGARVSEGTYQTRFQGKYVDISTVLTYIRANYGYPESHIILPTLVNIQEIRTL